MTDSKKKVGTIRLQNLSYAHKQAAVLMAAVKLDLFTIISQGAGTLSEIGRALKISSLNTERLVVACNALELIYKENGIYRNAGDVERFLVKEKPTYIGPWLIFAGSGFEQWKDLAEYLSSDEPPNVLGVYESLTEESAREYHQATYSVGLGAGILFAREVDMSTRTKILDLGGGSGAYCIAALQKYPQLTATVMDFEPVCKIARGFIADWNLEDSISTLSGDFTKDDFPADADVMIMASNLPQYNQDVLESIFLRANQALLPGGEFHLVGETLDNEKTGPLGPALWGLHEVIFGSHGRSHSEQEVISYLEKAGFENVTAHSFIPGSLSRISGQKTA